MTTEITPVTQDELMYTADLMAQKILAFEVLGLDNKEFLAGVTCLEGAAIGYLGMFTPKALAEYGVDSIKAIPDAAFAEIAGFFLAVQNKLASEGVDVRRVLSRDIDPTEPLSFADQSLKKDVEQAFPGHQWEYERPSANAFVARSGPMILEFDDTLPEPWGVFCEFPFIPSLDFRAPSVMEARVILTGLNDRLTRFLKTEEISE